MHSAPCSLVLPGAPSLGLALGGRGAVAVSEPVG